MVMTSGFSFFSTPLARAASRILRATSRVSSAMNGFLCGRGGGGNWGRAVEAHREYTRDVKGCTVRAILDLVPARGAVRDDQRSGVGAAYRRQQRQFGHFHRCLIGVGAVAECAGHAAATGLDDFDIEAGNEA